LNDPALGGSRFPRGIAAAKAAVERSEAPSATAAALAKILTVNLLIETPKIDPSREVIN